MKYIDELRIATGRSRSPQIVPGPVEGLFGRAPGEIQKLVRKIADAPNYDFAMMEFLDAMQMEWRDG